MDRSRVRRVLIGESPTVAIFAFVTGVLGGVGVWLVYPSLGEIAVSGTQYHYGLVPDQPLDWLFLGVFVLGPALTAFANGGLIASWWLIFPALYALEFPVMCPEGAAGGGMPPGCDQLLNIPIILIVLSIALVIGTLGYLLGNVVQRGLHPETTQ